LLTKRTPLFGFVFGALTVCALALAVSFPSVAQADENAPGPDVAPTDQYIEEVPTGGGDVTPGVAKERGAQLSASAERALEHAPPATAKILARISTSSSYGAPTKALARREGTIDSVTDPSAGEALRTSINALGGGSAGRLLGLLGVLFVTTTGAIAIAIRKHSY
jgi:hypothetical protein